MRSRRRIIKDSVAAAAMAIVPRHVLGGPGQVPPSEIITRATIGVGPQGFRRIAENKAGQPAVQLAVADVNALHLEKAVAKAGPACRGYADFRRVLDRKDIDVVHIATPDHWHAVMSVLAAQAGKDVLCEKPMTHCIGEGFAVIDAVRRAGRVLHVNTQGRHQWMFEKKLVSSGLLGWPLTVYLGPSTGFDYKLAHWMGTPKLPAEPVPAHLDYDMWLGPAPWSAFNRLRVDAGKFRGYWDYGGGGLLDMGQHYIDPAQWILGKDDAGPAEVESIAPPADWEVAGFWGRVIIRYEDGCRIILDSGEWGTFEDANRPLIEGPNGKVWGGKRGKQTEPAELSEELARFADPPKLVTLEEAVKKRRFDMGERPNAEAGHRSVTLLHLANISIRLGRKIRWDAQKQEILGDAEATRLTRKALRGPWHL